MKKFYLLALMFPFTVTAQYNEPAGGGVYNPGKSECISPAERAKAQNIANANRTYLKSQGRLATSSSKTTAVTFDWPLAQDPNFHYHSIYGISNFIDDDLAYPNQLLDYNCGNRTYDLSSGYNHGGVDIFLWPFSINMMQSGQARIVAAAAGTIIGKHDGEFDLNCAMSSATPNYIFLEHSDGTRTWYLHMKSGSLTTKNVGDAVVAGEFLGLVGSSGSSTGPHLHFEVHDAADVVIDPFTGPCNTSATMWNSQIPYKAPQINTLMTHSAGPVLQNCPQPDITNSQDTFMPGSTVFLGAYYHDQTSGLVSNFNIIRPDNSVYNSWSHNGGSGSGFYSGSYWYWSYNIPASEPLGEWKFRATYEGNSYEHKFYILNPLDVANTTTENVAIYPNPATNTLFLTGIIDYKITITDVLGKVVLVRENFSGNQMDISSLSTGMYFVKISNGDKTSTKKIAVQNK